MTNHKIDAILASKGKQPVKGLFNRPKDAMDPSSAKKVIARFLLPRVRAYVEFKRSGSEAGDFAFLSPCSVCYEPTFGGHWCLECRDAHATDPEKFAHDHRLCRNCFFPEGPEGCIDMCERWRDDMACDEYDRRGVDFLCQEDRRRDWDRD